MSLITSLSRYACICGAVLMALTGVMLTYEVVARYFFIRPTIWAAELSQLCLIWGCLLAMAHLLTLRRHITVNAVTGLLPPGAQKVCAGIALVVVIVFSAIVTIYGFDIFWTSFERGRTTGSILNLPIWISEASVPVGFALLGAQGAVELFRLKGSDTASLGATHE
ncbi:tripartite ATP-independent periplasmic transporter DctQ component [Dinoroseobacter shibae DFL 12 = DSM 16493]|jgi:TRAP-type C4-dicarboxylate transport system permease small subunit|uniref:TRAP transporter small permease protein n=1 Tax=Dinoroseobacter shibae (strain DSM 16493 / NCIMB 14021 / DFL 12) TaxID=398580 RepID=A8LHN5_DINSH|nr:TRAP transporter small permease [Dinoroseobacter shibae]ABV92832.1 tripartite ATP-independent periplasmic transporter DctQ component [Dinoroseobacter shibae DFL 12 = DSM 16493]URF47771.1 TRAP transporter small permease [Dinoroseobacter shibae]URF52081.1 TRAP transporter small permease [Dinoroseobacter shibae]